MGDEGVEGLIVDLGMSGVPIGVFDWIDLENRGWRVRVLGLKEARMDASLRVEGRIMVIVELRAVFSLRVF